MYILRGRQSVQQGPEVKKRRWWLQEERGGCYEGPVAPDIAIASPTPRFQPSTATPSSAPCGLVCIVVLSNADLLRNPAALPCSLTHVTSYTSSGWRDSGVTLCFIVFQSHFALYIIKFHRVSVLFCVTHLEVSSSLVLHLHFMT